MKYKLLSILMLCASIGVQAQEEFLCGDRIAVFYPPQFDSSQTLASFAIQKELTRQGDLPGDWDIRPVFTTDGEGKTLVEIAYSDDADLYGTGLVTGKLRRNGTSIEIWNKDNYGYYVSNCLYQSHPWVMGVRPDGKTFGIIADNSWRSKLELSNPMKITSEGPAFRVIVIERDSPSEMMQVLGELTGTINLPPLWALGFHQSRFNPTYKPDEIVAMGQEFRKRNLPCDVFWVDIDYMDGKRIFTYDANEFFNSSKVASPDALNETMHEMGYKMGYITDPGVKIDESYTVYQQGQSGDHWVKAEDKVTDYEGEVWPGMCKFPDFTQPQTREWWAGLYGEFYKAHDMDGAWNDMNEPGVFNTPEWTMLTTNWHRGGGDLAAGPHMRYHNLYGSLMTQASYEGLVKSRPDKRPFLLSRANHLGAQRYCATWTGDNLGTWEHMMLSVPMCITLGLSGQPFGGPDVGGYGLDVTPVLLAHWMALSAYYPFSRNHTSGCSQEPWVFGTAVENVSRNALNRRYRLLPYLYTLFHESSVDGMPVMRPLFFADLTDTDLRDQEQAFLLGGDLMVIPRWANHVTLPKGDWDQLQLEAEDDGYQPLLALRPGSVLPYLGHTVQTTAVYEADSLTLFVNPSDDGTAYGEMYDDAGEGFDYKNGDYALLQFNCEPYAQDSLAVTVVKSEGNLDKTRYYRVAVVGGAETYYSSWTTDSRIVVPHVEDVTEGIDLSKTIGKVIFVTGTFNDWDVDQYVLTGNTDGFMVSERIYIEKGDHRLKFTNSPTWSGDDWGDADGLSGVAKPSTGKPDITFHIANSGNYNIMFNPTTLEYAIMRTFDSNESIIYVGGTFNNWTLNYFSQMDLVDNHVWKSDAIYCEAGDQELKFVNTNNWSNKDWGGVEGLSGTAMETTGKSDSNLKFTLAESGYYVMTFNDQSLAYSIQRVSDPSAVEEVKAEPSCRIYPNPTDGILNVLLDVDNAQMRIFSQDGRCLQEQSLTRNLSTVDISSLPEGSYIVDFRWDKGHETQKLIKK